MKKRVGDIKNNDLFPRIFEKRSRGIEICVANSAPDHMKQRHNGDKHLVTARDVLNRSYHGLHAA
jgi:hypothetical protein